MSDIILEVQDGIAIATINRPERMNAFRGATYDELLAIAMRLDREEQWCGLVITGAGRAFSAGQDLDEIPGSGADARLMARLVERLQDITRHLARTAKPTVAAINGPAVGFGLECTLALDLRIASPAAYFLLPELARGLFHTNGTYHYLERLVGSGLAGDMILTGRRVDAEEARQSGLVTRIVDGGSLLDHAVATARQMADVAPPALRFAREGLRHAAARDLEQTLQFESRACLNLLNSGARP